MRKHFPIPPRRWVSLALLVVILLLAPIGYGLAQTATPTPSTSPLPTPTPTRTSTPTVAPISTSTPAPASTSTPIPPTGTILGYHTVKAGETLYCIGRAYGVDPYAIARQNGILNPNSLRVGQVLAIPNTPHALPPGPVCPRQFGGPTPPPSTCRYYYTVVAGDNLYRISLRYGVSMWAIAQANNILNVNYIRVGQVLCIP